ncbi:MAG: glycosyltransferase family 2 protein [Cyanobacteria bacterium J06635_1]
MTAISQALSTTSNGSVTAADIALIIPVRNRLGYTQVILTQLTEQIGEAQIGGDSRIQMIVVDDDSTDGTPGYIQQDFPAVHLIRGDGDLWWTGAIAQGMDYAVQQLNARYVVWLNDDIVLADDFIEQLGAECDRIGDQKIITGGVIRAEAYPDWLVFGGVVASRPINDIRQFDQQPILSVHTLNGNIAVMPTQLVADVGLPDTRRFRHYGGDFEYICRAKAAGYKVQLSSLLQATTDYSPSDVKRYMPLWIQWSLSPTLAEKWSVLKNLTNRKSPHNVEHMVNSIYRNAASVPTWQYTAFYCKKLVKIVGSELIPRSIRQQRIQRYLADQRVPSEVSAVLLKQAML